MSAKIPFSIVWSKFMEKRSKKEITVNNNDSLSPPQSAFSSQQLDFFQTFLCNTEEERKKLSNTIEFWESIPKYSMTQQAQNALRTKDGYLPVLEKSFVYNGIECTLKIAAAPIEEIIDGKKINNYYYPSANEEIVEDALRKMASDHQKGFFDDQGSSNEELFTSGVRFTLNALREELHECKKTRSHKEIVKSINILQGSNIVINFADGTAIAKASYLPTVFAASKTKNVEDANSKWVVQFHPLVTKSITKKSYRQYDYAVMMSHSTQLARWLYKKLAHCYTNASHITTYNIWMSTIQRDSGHLECKRQADTIRKLEDALKELTNNKVLEKFNRIETVNGERRKIIDIKYALKPHDEFIKDVRASNKRQSQALKSNPN